MLTYIYILTFTVMFDQWNAILLNKSTN